MCCWLRCWCCCCSNTLPRKFAYIVKQDFKLIESFIKSLHVGWKQIHAISFISVKLPAGLLLLLRKWPTKLWSWLALNLSTLTCVSFASIYFAQLLLQIPSLRTIFFYDFVWRPNTAKYLNMQNVLCVTYFFQWICFFSLKPHKNYFFFYFTITKK